MVRIPANESTPSFDDARTVTLREWITAGRAERRKWRSLRRKAKLIADNSTDSRAAAKAAEAASRCHDQDFRGNTGP
jgi:hypothetical protein